MSSINKRTKRMLADSLQELMIGKSLSKIRIGDICKTCGVNRQTFYYHFQDKYELVGWVFAQDSIVSMIQSPSDSILDKLEHGIGLIWQQRFFYRKALEEPSQNSLRQSMQNYNIRLCTEVMKAYLHTQELSRDQELSIRYHSQACIGLTIEWLNGLLELSVGEFAQLQARHMPHWLIEAFQGISSSKVPISLC